MGLGLAEIEAEEAKARELDNSLGMLQRLLSIQQEYEEPLASELSNYITSIVDCPENQLSRHKKAELLTACHTMLTDPDPGNFEKNKDDFLKLNSLITDKPAIAWNALKLVAALTVMILCIKLLTMVLPLLIATPTLPGIDGSGIGQMIDTTVNFFRGATCFAAFAGTIATGKSLYNSFCFFSEGKYKVPTEVAANLANHSRDDFFRKIPRASAPPAPSQVPEVRKVPEAHL